MPGAVAMAGRKLVPRPMQRRSLPSCVANRNLCTAPGVSHLVKGMGGASREAGLDGFGRLGRCTSRGGARANSSGALGLLGRSVPPRGSSES